MICIDFSFVGNTAKVGISGDSGSAIPRPVPELFDGLTRDAYTIVDAACERFSEAFRWCKATATGQYRKGRHIVFYWV
jgi:hypothetical protein